MPRIIAKFGYMKPNLSTRSNFVEYISNRDGVIKNIESFTDNPVTPKQTKLINELIARYPNAKKSNIYSNFTVNQSLGMASELITYIEENHFESLNNIEQYVEYIANRPRVLKEESHGLFSSRDEPIVLSEVKEDIKNHKGNVWTAIISLKREDAERLTYNNLQSWKVLVRSQINTLSDNLQININNFKWYGAFHNESHHPHIHLVMYSTNEKEGYLNKTSIDKIRSSFAKTIFKHDLMNIYKKQTEYRDELKLSSKTYLQSIVSNINKAHTHNQEIEDRLVLLSNILKTTKGKHTYGYLSKPTKKIVDEIVNLASQDSNIKKLLDLWYEQRQEILYTYTDEKTKIDNLADIDAFRSVKNIVIKVAKEISDEPIEISNVQDDIDIEKTEVVDNPPSFEVFDKKNELEQLLIDETIDFKSLKDYQNEPDNKTTVNIETITASIKLLYHISNMIEDSLIDNSHKYHADKELLKNIKRKKVILGHHKDD